MLLCQIDRKICWPAADCAELADINNVLKARQQFLQQQTENEIVKQELDLVEEGSAVYKLIGPALIKQDLVEAKANVSKRLEFIGGELARLLTQMRTPQEKLHRAQEQMVKLQQEAQRIQAAQASKASKSIEEEA
ncbi:hypothetical protein WJX81_003383 [Elliptochloris bilobata]|uniref:Prefoldin subunit 6 n=1 Tax=Elliptochloris bilobata TaxID=381761 RepID=A0AAW1RXE4_9CHLO